MLEKTDTDYAPWHVIASDDKRHARLAGLKIMVEELSRGTTIVPQDLDQDVARAARKLWGWTPKDDK